MFKESLLIQEDDTSHENVGYDHSAVKVLCCLYIFHILLLGEDGSLLIFVHTVP